MEPAVSQTDIAQQLVAELRSAPVSARPLRDVVARLPALLDADQAAALLIRSDDRGRRLEFFHGACMPAGIRLDYDRWLSDAPNNFACYDPDRPDPRQRNRALRSQDLLALNGNRKPAVSRTFLPRFGLADSDQLRVLVCEGDSLLSWVGAYRTRPFLQRHVRLLDSIVPALRDRLNLERQLVEAHERAEEIGGALEQVPSAAFILAANGSVLHANAAGRALLDRERPRVEEMLAAGIRGAASGVQVARLDKRSTLMLAVLPHFADPAPLVGVARGRWQLTPRQAQVLQLVAQGMSNRAVAASLQCAESTVELHVTALLDKSQCDNRAHLVARLWSGV
ncbi:MAG TPA: LuxR C-terminal-related transcriptional regulator [Myxococcales bacterium]|jgi:DNA-binding CsgD family transcriptional regulator|nr:LuxR C-terminal-related transcriptional regulator [Myxococcales bacterium]